MKTALSSPEFLDKDESSDNKTGEETDPVIAQPTPESSKVASSAPTNASSIMGDLVEELGIDPFDT